MEHKNPHSEAKATQNEPASIFAYESFRAEVLRVSPWVKGWLTEATQHGPGPLTPRNFIKTPYALTTLAAAPNHATFLDGIEQPWMALQILLPMLVQYQSIAISAASVVHKAIFVGNAKLVTQAARADPALNKPSTMGYTALTLATFLGRLDLMATLLASGAQVNAVDALGNTALHWGCITRHGPVCALLRQHGASEEAENIFSGRPQDYDDAWNHDSAEEFELGVQDRSGEKFVISDPETFTKTFGYTHAPRSRLGIDFFIQWVTHLGDAKWLQEVRQLLQSTPPFQRDAFAEAPLALKHFGDPWGWGVITLKDLDVGEPVVDYCGDIVHTYETMVDLLLCGMNPYIANCLPSKDLQSRLCAHFDAWRSGNLGSRINSAHAQGAQSLGFSARYWRGLPRCQFFADRPIKRHAQLSWCYGNNYWQARGNNAQPLPEF